MSRLLVAEVRKAVSAPANWLLLGVSAALSALSTVLLVALADEGGVALLTDHKLQEAMHGASVGTLLVVVAGCLAMAGDWRHGQAANTFLTQPRRSRVVAARATVFAGVGAVFGLVAAAAALAGAAVAYRAESVTFPLDRSAVWLTLAGVVAAAVLMSALGVALGAVTRSPVVGTVGALGWLFIVEPIVFSASTEVARFLPGTAATALGRAPEPDLLAPGAAALVLGTVTATALALGAHLVRRADVTA